MRKLSVHLCILFAAIAVISFYSISSARHLMMERVSRLSPLENQLAIIGVVLPVEELFSDESGRVEENWRCRWRAGSKPGLYA